MKWPVPNGVLVSVMKQSGIASGRGLSRRLQLMNSRSEAETIQSFWILLDLAHCPHFDIDEW
jgi:hypothetical protein